MKLNAFGQPIGNDIANWQGCQRPERVRLSGQYCDLVPLNPDEHSQALFDAFALDSDGKNWTYLISEPPHTLADFQQWLLASCCGDDPLYYTILDKRSGKAIGLASLMRIDPKFGVIEVGNIHFSPLLQKTPLATEAMYLLMKYVFDELGYRRYEWKCDSHNEPSKRAAERFGFHYEGLFRQALVYKGRNRDTSWFSIIDTEWPERKHAFERWLAPDNFTSDGQQIQRLQDFRRE